MIKNQCLLPVKSLDTLFRDIFFVTTFNTAVDAEDKHEQKVWNYPAKKTHLVTLQFYKRKQFKKKWS